MTCVCGAEPSNKDIGVEVQGVFDGILLWECGSCRSLRPRFTDPADKLHRIALELIDKWGRVNP